MTSPWCDDTNARLAATLAGEPAGRLLAIYASIRSTTRVPDALTGLGVPVIAYVLDSAKETPLRVTAIRSRHSAHNPLLGLGTDVEMWSILLRCASEVSITVDVAAGPWTTDAGPVETRVEWMWSERVTTFHPKGSSVASQEAGDCSLGLTGIEERLLEYAVDLCDLAADGDMPMELAAASRVAGAARESVAGDVSINLIDRDET